MFLRRILDIHNVQNSLHNKNIDFSLPTSGSPFFFPRILTHATLLVQTFERKKKNAKSWGLTFANTRFPFRVK